MFVLISYFLFFENENIENMFGLINFDKEIHKIFCAYNLK